MFKLNNVRAVILAGTVAIPTVAVTASTANASNIAPQVVHAECTTRATEWDGRRHGCASKVSVLKAPSGFVFAEKKFTANKTSKNGSEHSCKYSFEKYVEVIEGTGIMQPTEIKVRGKARSPKGSSSGRGWVNCTFTAPLTAYVR